jgi:ABC-type nitrate/sulfonate/bicarbonate transport system ATPase subunit
MYVIIIPIYRVALARAVYARTKYVLLDDPLSAVVSLTLSK